MVDESSSERGRLRRAFLTGVAVIVPSVITLAVLAFVFNAIYDYLDVFSSAIVPLLPRVTLPVVGDIGRELAIEVATPVVFVGSILFLGLVVDSTRYGELAVDYADYAIEQVPGVGSVYQGFRQMSDAMLESDGENFQEVVLVEFPTEGVYTLAFVTSETPAAIAEPTDADEMRTLFMPMAPNPVMGGHVVFVPERRIVEVNLTVDERRRAGERRGGCTRGVAGGDPRSEPTERGRIVTYELRDHTADVAVEATAPTLSALFEAVADGLTAASCETVPESGDRFEITVRAERRDALLFDFLDQLIYERDVRLVLPTDHRCTVSGPEDGDAGEDEDEAWTVEATARGVPLDDVAAREIKAVTYSEMTLERRGGGWYAYVVLDV